MIVIQTHMTFSNNIITPLKMKYLSYMQPQYPKKPRRNNSTTGKKPINKFNQVKILEKEQIKPKTGFTEFPSSKLTNIKTADPFSQKKSNSFAHLYSSGAIPCKIQHGSVSMKLKWNADVEVPNLPYNPLLVTCFDGLIEEKHPYGFIAYNVSKEMIVEPSSTEKLIDLLTKLVWPLRTALSNKNQQICQRALDILQLLSERVGSHLNPHVKNLVTPIKKHLTIKKLKEKAINTLRALDDNGGQEVGKIIKAAIPTYSNT